MKKIIALVLTSVLALSVFAGCANNDTTPETPETPGTEEPNEEPGEEEPGEEEPAVEAGAITKMGLGIITNIGKSKDLEEGKATAQVDSVIVAAGFDADGKIVSVTIDTAQDRVVFEGEMELTTDTSVAGKTKLEKGDEYGMKGAAAITGLEWFEQIGHLTEWMIGKTVAEVVAMPTYEKDPSHLFVPDVEELKTTVSITIEGYLAALEEAWATAVDVDGAEKVGLGVVTSLGKSKSQSEDAGAMAQVDSTIVATALKADGTIAGTIIDTAQTKINFDMDGVVTNDKSATVKSKAELGEEYGMKKASGIGKEWDEQALAFAAFMTGKTVAEVTGMELAEDVPTAEDLTSSVTIKVGGYLAALEKAGNNAK